MGEQYTFKRYEIKYLITREQKEKLLKCASDYMVADEYRRSSISNIYFDTPNYMLIRRSLDRPVYKEKLRLRGYGTVDDQSQVFVELKKKYKSVVYKRRVKMSYEEAMEYLTGEGRLIDEKRDYMGFRNNQILKEMDYFQQSHSNLRPSVYLAYERESYKQDKGLELRITFDDNIVWRDEDISLEKGRYGVAILPDGKILMEVKTPYAMPLWLVRIMSEEKIYKTSFSKYGNAYRMMKQTG